MPELLRYRDPELCDALAARYVAGAMTVLSRRRFERLCTHEPLLADAVQLWSTCMLPIQSQLRPHPPPPHHWQTIAHRIGVTAPPPLWQRLWTWRLTTLAATCCALLLALWILLHSMSPHTPDYLAPMTTASGETALVISGYQGDMPGTSRLLVQWTDGDKPTSHSYLTLWGQSSDSAPVFLGEILPDKDEWKMSPERWQALINSQQLLVSLDISPPPTPEKALYRGPCLHLYSD